MGKKVKTKTDVDPEEELKKSLAKFKKIDPDFSTFLEDNYDIEDENSEDDDDDVGSQADGTDTVHEPGPLQADSDESDFEDEDAKKIHGKVTLKMVSQWQSELQDEKKVKLTTITTVIKVFNAAMLRVTSDNEEKIASDFRVEGSGVFNAVIQMCVLYLPAAIKKYLGMDQSGKDPQKCKHFVKIKGPLIAYLSDLLTLLGGVTSTNILTVLLKHLHQICTYVACFGRISKKALKRLIMLWSTGEETVRVLAFLCILRITRNQQATLLDIVLKSMYLTYVKNCKFVSPTTWPGINFMRRSLVEMFSLDLNVSYQHVFLYIRQLAIHLRNGIVVQKVENRQAIYNWQFVNSLHLWADLLGATSNKPQLQPLIYPLVMIITNTIKLVPTHQYYPVRFHCVEILVHLSKDSDTFMPILPFLGEILTGYDFNKKHKKVSMKPLDFSCVLRLGKSQLAENGFKDSVIENVYSLLLEYLANESHRIGFPDLVVLAVMQIKEFLKKCSVSNYTKKMRQLLEKIEENSKFIERERGKVSFALSDQKMITAWEANIKAKGTPLYTFYESWNKINKVQKRKKITKNDELADVLPAIKKLKRSSEPEVKPQNAGPVELFPSDSEDDASFDGSEEDDDEIKISIKKKMSKPMKAIKASKIKVNKESTKDSKKQVQKKVKKAKLAHNDVEDTKDDPDVVEEFSANDW